MKEFIFIFIEPNMVLRKKIEPNLNEEAIYNKYLSILEEKEINEDLVSYWIHSPHDIEISNC